MDYEALNKMIDNIWHKEEQSKRKWYQNKDYLRKQDKVIGFKKYN